MNKTVWTLVPAELLHPVSRQRFDCRRGKETVRLSRRQVGRPYLERCVWPAVSTFVHAQEKMAGQSARVKIVFKLLLTFETDYKRCDPRNLRIFLCWNLFTIIVRVNNPSLH